ncbi:hypothetical protein N8T08_001512 [Aspergillus melleus]|uniref:Uncharacterized protein n=1 Tax=Aspergillus melleus TaxID=138277 RepID=A0ACC3BAA4_9EURO|nr:hypothetical protein N8T08_001512 [Aspergillus melleus]
MATQLQNFILAEIQKFRLTAKDVVTSRTWWYPFQGLIYLSTHEPLRRPFLSRLGQTITLGVGITTGMFFFTYLPQTALLSLTSGPWAPISAALLVISESASLTTFVARSWSLRDDLTDTFDATLLEKGADELVKEGRFGIAAVSLEMVPFLSLAFAFSNTVGAALWAADLEREEKNRS